MSVTRTPLCTVKVCPFPTDPWAHVCAVCEAPAVHHHHREPKGMGGSKARDVSSNIVMLCAIHHMEEHGIQEDRDERRRMDAGSRTDSDGSRWGDDASSMGESQGGVKEKPRRTPSQDSGAKQLSSGANHITSEHGIGASTGEGEHGGTVLVRGDTARLPSPAGASGVPSDGGEAQHASGLAVPSSEAGPLVESETSPPSPGAYLLKASREPEERVGRDSRESLAPPFAPAAVTPPGSLASGLGATHG